MRNKNNKINQTGLRENVASKSDSFCEDTSKRSLLLYFKYIKSKLQAHKTPR
jgi:hypothetical protein